MRDESVANASEKRCRFPDRTVYHLYYKRNTKLSMLISCSFEESNDLANVVEELSIDSQL